MAAASSSNGDLAGKYGPAGPFGPAFRLIPGVQSYDWGKTAKEGSLVARYAAATAELDFDVQDDSPYAELWMGTHSTLPSSIVPPEDAPRPPAGKEGAPPKYISLASYLSRHPALVHAGGGKANGVAANGSSSSEGQLPFLFKILSIGKALSIQAHPNKKLAEKLHEEKPKMYKDDNHKPEMAIALTPFRGFCGFRPLAEIADFLDKVPEFKALVGASDVFTSTLTYSAKPASNTPDDEVKKLLKEVFSLVMNAKPTEIKRQVMTIAQRFRKALDEDDDESIEVEKETAELVCLLNSQFPGDIGVMCAFVLNVVDLEPGQAMFLQADEPHAYISGDIVECMAASDNVVRAGLTPKARDVQVLVDMLTYDTSPADEKRMSPEEFPSADDESIGATLVYDPPIDEFAVLMTTLEAGQSERQRALSGPSILIFTDGHGELTSHPSDALEAQERTFKVEKGGQVFFIGADTELTIKSGKARLVGYRAFYEPKA